MAAVTASVLIANAAVKSDIRDGNFLNPSEWMMLVNDGYKALWAVVMGANPDFRVTDQPVVISSTATPSSALPSDYFATRLVIRDYGLISEEILDRDPVRIARRENKRTYRVDGVNLVIEPWQRSVGNYTHRYNPDATLMTLTTSAIDAELGRFSNFIELHAAIAARVADNDATDSLSLALYGNPNKQQRGVIDDVRDWAASKRSAEPDKVEDIRPRRRRDRGSYWPT